MITNKFVRHIFQERFLLIILIVSVFAVGFYVRTSMALTLPIWLDERIGLEISENSFREILSGKLDPTHLPTYYLITKLMSTLPNSNLILRLLSVFVFILNSILIYKIGGKTMDKTFGVFATIAYSLSGYFFIFDWQARMYAPLLLFILASLYGVIANFSPKLLFIINLLGLSFDYGFLYYLLPQVLIHFFVLFTKHKLKITYHYLFTTISCLTIFLILWYLNYSQLITEGLKNTSWNIQFSNLTFFGKYVSGIHSNFILLILLPLFLAVGLTVFAKNLNRKLIYLIFSGIASAIAALIASLFFPQILHVRMLQVSGLSLLFLTALGMKELYLKNRFITIIFIFGLLIGLLINSSNLALIPGYYLIAF